MEGKQPSQQIKASRIRTPLKDKQMFLRLVGETYGFIFYYLESYYPQGSFIGVMIHITIKIITTLQHSSEVILERIIPQNLVLQLFLVLLAFDFWITKNISGRMLMGVRWYYGQNKYGVEKLMFECRVNQNYVNKKTTMIFWIVQVIYTFVPLYHLKLVLSIQSSIYQIDIHRYILLVVIFIFGSINIYYFYKVNSAISVKRSKLKLKYGIQFLQKMGNASMHSWV